jgi:hypothetical protein
LEAFHNTKFDDDITENQISVESDEKKTKNMNNPTNSNIEPDTSQIEKKTLESFYQSVENYNFPTGPMYKNILDSKLTDKPIEIEESNLIPLKITNNGSEPNLNVFGEININLKSYFSVQITIAILVILSQIQFFSRFDKKNF